MRRGVEDDRIFGIFLNKAYGFTLVRGKEIVSFSSIGGYGNSESKIGIYEVGTLLVVHTYKNRRPASYWELTKEGWQCLGNDIYTLGNLKKI